MTVAPRPPDPTTLLLQAEASDPRRSAWVSANAGSGKTFVLARRVVRLLLAGADPARLLCLTFTKAAAAEMAKRVFNELAKWVRLDDDALDAELAAMEGRPPTREMRARARRLFAHALETPGGLKIQTVHAFCERLLHQFPFEANVPGHFQVLEENAANIMVRDARRAVLHAASTDLTSPLGQALRTVVMAASDYSHEIAIAELVENRQALERWVASRGSLDAALEELQEALGVDGAPSPADVEARILAEAALSPPEIAMLVDALRRTGSSNDAKAAARLGPYLTASSDAGRMAAYRDFFCKSDGGLRKASALVTAKVRNSLPDIDEKFAGECRRLELLFEQVYAAECYVVSAAALRLAAAVIDSYQRQKHANGLLDFDDLIGRTLALLSHSDAARWVHYKIDQGLDHILLDEAQDTSPGQWQVIKALADDFFSGEGAHAGVRTLFAVGDEKQSIYSFQGAVPSWFSRVKAEIALRAAGADRDFSDLRLTVSFRSTPDIVGAVDRVFAPVAAHTGLASEAVAPVHEAVRRNEPGMVIVWPMIEPPEEVEPGDWAEPLDHLGNAAPEMVLANRIAGTIKAWTDPVAPERFEATGQPIRPGDVLILTRKRGPLSEAINRALKTAGVAIAGADRLALADHIAVRDLIALGDALLQDRDDLSLAAALKSPLFGVSEDALFALAHDRGPQSLWQGLKDSADAEPFTSIYRTLVDLRSRIDTLSPFAFYAHILGPRRGRKKFAQRLGPEAEDIVDEFLAQALVYERLENPSLQGFLHWIRSTATEIRRETETLRDEVRVMTVHGAKGLEAGVVFLVDDGSAPAHPGHDANFLAITDDPDSAEPAPLVWTRGGRKLPRAVKMLVDRGREAAKEEYRRLLYVGLTRARDQLVVCGTLNTNTDKSGGWHALVTSALLAEATPGEAVDGSAAYVWRAGSYPAVPAAAAAERGPETVATPAWLTRSASLARSGRKIRPSALPEAPATFEARADLVARMGGSVDALERGRIIHRLLEALPVHAPEKRREVAERFLAGAVPDWPASERAALTGEVMAVLDDARFAAVFGPGSLAEVDIAADVDVGGENAALSGRIDRLAVTGSEVLIVDYKTNRPAPVSADAVPEAYLSQLALYRETLRRIYPERAVVCAILWTNVPSLMPIPANLLDAAEATLMAPAPENGVNPVLSETVT